MVDLSRTSELFKRGKSLFFFLGLLSGPTQFLATPFVVFTISLLIIQKQNKNKNQNEWLGRNGEDDRQKKAGRVACHGVVWEKKVHLCIWISFAAVVRAQRLCVFICSNRCLSQIEPFVGFFSRGGTIWCHLCLFVKGGEGVSTVNVLNKGSTFFHPYFFKSQWLLQDQQPPPTRRRACFRSKPEQLLTRWSWDQRLWSPKVQPKPNQWSWRRHIR